jgi:hypothetical protein
MQSSPIQGHCLITAICGGRGRMAKWKYCIRRNFCSQTSKCTNLGWRYIVVLTVSMTMYGIEEVEFVIVSSVTGACSSVVVKALRY